MDKHTEDESTYEFKENKENACKWSLNKNKNNKIEKITDPHIHTKP